MPNPSSPSGAGLAVVSLRETAASDVFL